MFFIHSLNEICQHKYIWSRNISFYRTFHDFGIVILDILYCYAEDSGTYECRATNKQGTDSISCSFTCSEKSGLILTPQVPGEMQKSTISKISQLESGKIKISAEDGPTSGVAPRFTVPIENMVNLREGENAHFEARLIPTDDPTLSIEWYVKLSIMMIALILYTWD